LSQVDSRLQAFSSRLATEANTHVAATLEQWFETLPFPLASILRAWQTTPSQDYKTKHEHLLHFFEATAEFLSVIYLSAFESQQALFAGHKEKLAEAWKKQNLSIDRPTFGTWKVVVEYFSKQIRMLLAGESDNRALCAQLFADPTNALPGMLANKGLAAVLSATNKMRNDWTGHGGVVSQPESRLRNEQLLAELQKIREAMTDIWEQVQLVSALHCQPRRGMFENEIAILVGSNSEFLTVEETFAKLVALANSLDAEQKRAVEEGLGDDELALFDLIFKEPVSKAGRERLKQASKKLLASLREILRPMPDWTQNTSTQAEVKIHILDHLWQTLPRPPYTEQETEQVAARVYDYVFQRSASGADPLAA
jgi:hypothetical protein